MVRWKGDLKGEVGEKAHNLDELEEFNVPNFFVITPEEVEELFKDVKGKDQVLNSQVKGEIRNKIKEAYQDVGVSSEVRNAVGKAKSLVGGQRNNSLVSVRVSNRNPGEYEHELNVGSSNLFKAIKKVSSSYYEENNDHPSIIVQKMVEPEYSGAVISDYSRNGLVEIVEGLGTALEEGDETPHLYLIGREGIVDKRINREQNKVERNPINGNRQRKSSGSFDLDDEEIKQFFGEVASREINVKFVYKRGSFHVVDAWKAVREDQKDIESLKGVKIGSEKVEGELGSEIKFSEKPINPEKYKALISKNGGYTTTNVQKARRYDKEIVVAYAKQLDDGAKVEINNYDIVKEIESEAQALTKDSREVIEETNASYSFNQILGSELLPLNPSKGDGLYTGSIFDEKLQLIENGNSERLDQESIVQNYEDVFGFDGGKLILDIRDMDKEEEVIDYLEAKQKIIILKDADLDTVEKAISVGFKKFIVPEEDIERFRTVIAKAEKKFILDKLRDK